MRIKGNGIKKVRMSKDCPSYKRKLNKVNYEVCDKSLNIGILFTGCINATIIPLNDKKIKCNMRICAREKVCMEENSTAQ